MTGQITIISTVKIPGRVEGSGGILGDRGRREDLDLSFIELKWYLCLDLNYGTVSQEVRVWRRK